MHHRSKIAFSSRGDLRFGEKNNSFLPCYRGGEFAARELEGPVFGFCALGPLLSAAQTVPPGSRGGMSYLKLGGLASNHLPPWPAESTAALIAAIERRPSIADG
jgi:hypothetical protein